MMKYMGFNTCRSDGDMWMRLAVDTSELGEMANDGLPKGERYY